LRRHPNVRFWQSRPSLAGREYASADDEPYHIARRFASLDHLSEGHAGWNLVTTSNPDAALNFGRDEQMEHDERYRRARVL
jgi:alkanesulfonate monooxygenase SsuD/methylene tetrahydromethanopterin reductase-like flavin-dependent oxidoreductase (luciferase family)